jgi:hypothetical protein
MTFGSPTCVVRYYKENTMSVVFTGTNQGRFTSTGAAQIIQLRSNLDWMWVINETVSYAAGAGTGAEFYWQRGMTQGRGIIYTKTAATNALATGQIAANAGFYLVDSSVNLPGPSLSLTGITGATPPVVLTANTGSLNNGDIVRIFSTVGALQLGGLDFTIGNISAGTSFELSYMAAIAAASPGAGTFRRIPYDALFYPRRRYITNITQAAQAVVTLSVTHGYTVGQVVRFVIPTVTALAFGMTELDGLQGTIVAINTTTNTITVDIDTTGFTAFAFPLTTSPGFTPAQIVPIGDNTAESLLLNANILSDATVNTGYIGIQLQAGTGSPAGVSTNVIYWVAGKSFSVDNQ